MACKDYSKELRKDEGGQQVIDLYHATLDTEGVCKNGLKTSRDSPYCSLGTGCQTKELISFTSDPLIAENIARDIQTKVMIARGDITPKNICEALDKRDKKDDQKLTPCEIWKDTFKKCIYKDCITDDGTREPWNAQTEKNEHWEMLKNGYIEVPSNGIIKEVIEYFGWKPSAYYEDKPKNVKVSTAFKEIEDDRDQIRAQQQLFELWKNYYLFNREMYGGFPNPVFSEDPEISKLKNIDPCKIGVVKVQGHIPTESTLLQMERYLTENEWVKLGFQSDIFVDRYNNEIRLAPDRFDKLTINSILNKNCKL